MVSLCTLFILYPILAIQGLQRGIVEFHCGKILPLTGRSVWRKIMFEVPRLFVLCSILLESSDLMHLLQERPNGDFLKSPAPEMLCHPKTGLAWQVKEKGIAWEDPLGSLQGTCRHW